MEAALMSAAYGSPEIVADLFESADNDIKGIGGALLDAAAPWAQMRAAAASGAIPTDMDTTPHLVDAVNLVRRARAEGRGIHDLANHNDILSGQVEPSVKQFLRLFFVGDRLQTSEERRDGKRCDLKG